jgi:pectinesterase
MKMKHLKNYVLASLLLAATTALATTRSVPSQYPTISAAVAAAANGDTISIANGTYNEQVVVGRSQANLTFIGASQTGVILQAGANQTAMVINGTNILVEYMTIQNTVNSGSTSDHAVLLYGGKIEFYRCYIDGWQDTLGVWYGPYYFSYCEIRGEEDFIYSGGPAYFSVCNIREMNTTGGNISAPSTPQTVPFGMVFNECSIVRSSNVENNSTTLFRPWYPYGETAYINCSMDSHITAAAWAADGDTTMRGAEYGSKTLSGQTIDLSTRPSWVVRLTAAQVSSTYSRSSVLNGWTPPIQ